MDFTRQRQESEFIIKSKQGIIRRIFSILLAVLMWIYSTTVIIFFLSAMLNYNNGFERVLKLAMNVSNIDIRRFLILSILIFGITFLILFLWKRYNKYRYGSLNRRKYPEDATDEDMLGLNLVDKDTYNKLQNEKVVVFESNPIREL